MMDAQHTTGWFRARLGKITGSCVGKIMGKGRTKDAKFSKTGYSYLHAIAAERMLPSEIVWDEDLFMDYLDETTAQSKAMRIGNERESDARFLYSHDRGRQVAETGCVDHAEIRGFASSPDGVVADAYDDLKTEGVIEIKCPSPAVYMEYLISVKDAESLKAMNADYYWQCMSHIMVKGAKWCDFVVYCPYNTQSLHVVRIEADAEAIAQLEGRVAEALEYVESISRPL